MTSKKVEQFRTAAQLYFGCKENMPFSIQEVCAFMGINYKTLCSWEAGSNKELACLAGFVKAKVATVWEKGELPVGLSTYLHKTYIGENQEMPESNANLSVNLVVTKDEV